MCAASSDSGLSRSTEDYLKAIYDIESRDLPAQTSAIAEALNVAPPSVSGMVKRLSEAGLLEHVPYRGVQLTREGRREALKLIRRHRVIETYLTSRLGYDWDSVHDEAERLEHAASDLLIERMAETLGDPQYDPHGAPIPTVGGDIEEAAHMPLSEVPVGRKAILKMVSDKDPERLRFLASLGLKPGVSFEVLDQQPFQGPITIRLAGGPDDPQVIGYELSRAIRCAVVE